MVNKSLIKLQLKQMTDELKNIKDSEEGVEIWTEKLSQIIIDAILSAEVVEVPFSVTGVSPSGAVTGVASQTQPGKLM